MPKTPRRSIHQKQQHKQLQTLQNTRKEQLTVSNCMYSPRKEISQNIFLPSVSPCRLGKDRYVSEKIKYQRNLYSIITDLHQTIQSNSSRGFQGFASFSSSRRPNKISNIKWEELRVKPVSLSPIKKELSRPIKREISKRSKNQEDSRQTRKSKKEKMEVFDFEEPWQTIHELQIHSFDI